MWGNCRFKIEKYFIEIFQVFCEVWLLPILFWQFEVLNLYFLTSYFNIVSLVRLKNPIKNFQSKFKNWSGRQIDLDFNKGNEAMIK